jgi:hypothetical protein
VATITALSAAHRQTNVSSPLMTTCLTRMLSANGGVFQINLGAGTGHFVGWPARRAEFAHRVMWIAGQRHVDCRP